jgi:hypothetical protein
VDQTKSSVNHPVRLAFFRRELDILALPSTILRSSPVNNLNGAGSNRLTGSSRPHVGCCEKWQWLTGVLLDYELIVNNGHFVHKNSFCFIQSPSTIFIIYLCYNGVIKPKMVLGAGRGAG